LKCIVKILSNRLTAEEDKINTWIEELELLSTIYTYTKSILLTNIHKSQENIKEKTLPHENNVHKLI